MNKKYDKNYKGPLLNPTADPTFKSLFTDNSPEANIALTSFLSVVLGKPVCDVKIVSNEIPKESLTDKAAIFDVTCHFKDESEVLEIEMQGRNEHQAYDNRAEYYVAHLLNHYTKRGTDWFKVPKAYQISVLNFIYDKNDDSGLSHYVMRKENGETLTQRMNIIFIELPKMKKLDTDIKDLTSIEKWSNFFLYAGNKDKQNFVDSLAQNEEGIMAAQKVLSKISQDEINWQRERDHMEYIMTTNTIKHAALQSGIEEGIKQGIARQKKEDKKLIAQITAQKDAEIESLKLQLANALKK